MQKTVYIFGDPVAHSKSPAMHTAAYQTLGIEDQYEYLKKHVKPEELKDAVTMLRGANVAGANITIPHKENVMQYLDEVDPQAQAIGAVNTVVNQNGKLIGYNTDAPGYLKSLENENNFNTKDKKVAIFGAGGAAKAIAFILATQGNTQSIAIADLDLNKVKQITQNISGCTGYAVHDPLFLQKVSEADLVINTTPLGMHPHEEKTALTDLSVIKPHQLYSDIVYVPKDTLFLKNALSKGTKVHYGWGMLLWQGVIAFSHFTQVPLKNIPVDSMKKILLS